jgi:hypothetical protein
MVEKPGMRTLHVPGVKIENSANSCGKFHLQLRSIFKDKFLLLGRGPN